jgi:hypothetical protein
MISRQTPVTACGDTVICLMITDGEVARVRRSTTPRRQDRSEGSIPALAGITCAEATRGHENGDRDGDERLVLPGTRRGGYSEDQVGHPVFAVQVG